MLTDEQIDEYQAWIGDADQSLSDETMDALFAQAKLANALRARLAGGPVGVVGEDKTGVWQGGIIGGQFVSWTKKPDSTCVFLFKPLPVGTPLYAAAQTEGDEHE